MGSDSSWWTPWWRVGGNEILGQSLLTVAVRSEGLGGISRPSKTRVSLDTVPQTAGMERWPQRV
jgi:hypothetical protein